MRSGSRRRGVGSTLLACALLWIAPCVAGKSCAAGSDAVAGLGGAGTRAAGPSPAPPTSRAEAQAYVERMLHVPDDDELPSEVLRLDAPTRPAGRLEAARAAEDVERFFHLLSHGWCGYGHFQGKGDFAAAKRSILAEVHGKGSWSPDGLGRLISRHLGFVHDCHLSVGRRQFCGHLHFWHDTRFQLRRVGEGYRFRSGGRDHVVLAVNGRSPRERVFASLNAQGDAIYRLGVLSRSEPEPLLLATSDGRAVRRWTVRLRRSDLAAYGDARIKFGEDRIGGIPVLRVRSFRDRYANELTRFLNAAERYRGAPYLILDVRGNRGGNDSWPWAWIERFTGRAPSPNVISTRLISKTSMMGLVNIRREEMATVPDRVKGRFRRDVAAYGASADSFERRLTRPHWTALRFPEVRRIPNPTTLIVVTDGNVASAGEGLLSFLFRQVDNVVTVGENSTGAVTFGETSVHRLPHSGLRVVLPIQLLVRSDLEWIEERGFAPDFWVPAGDALNYAVAAARKGTIPTVATLPAGHFAGPFVPERRPWRRWLSGRRSMDVLGACVLLVVGVALFRLFRRRPALLAAYGGIALAVGGMVVVRGVLAGFWLVMYGVVFLLASMSRPRRARTGLAGP